MARPSEYDYDLCVEICEIISQGNNIINTLKSDSRFPSWLTFSRWKRENDELRKLYANSQQNRSEAIEAEIFYMIT